MNKFIVLLSLCVALLACTTTSQSPSTGAINNEADNVVSFVSCPIYRDTDQGPKSGCWLATDPSTGLRYDVGFARSKPYMGRAALIDGIVDTQEANVCGGIVLKPARVAVLPTKCDEFIIPAEQYSGRPFVLPKEVLRPTDVKRELPPPPYENRRYHVYFSMHSDFPIYQYSEIMFEKMALYIRASKAKRVTITGYADTQGLVVSGRQLQEDISMAERRARNVSTALQRLLVPEDIIEEEFSGQPSIVPGGDEGLLQASKRRVTIDIEI